MSKIAKLKLDGRDYIILSRAEYQRLVGLARIGRAPAPAVADNVREVPAVEYARASIAREVVRRRTDAGLSQRELAASAGVRVETVCRLEKGRNIPSTATIAAIESALLATERKRARKRRSA
jgi:ribosome-binding protein aMBF1 (putative translation factor)